MLLATALALVLAGQTPVSAPEMAPAPEYLAWPGFGFLPAGDRTLARSVAVRGDWSGVDLNASSADDAKAPVWRLKLFAIKKIFKVEKMADGTLFDEKCSLENPELDRINKAVGLLKAVVRAETNGAVRLAVDLTIAPDTIIQRSRTLQQVIQDFTYPRFNGGLFDSEDKVYRGPYDSVICIHPDPTPDEGTLTVNGTPVTYVSAYGPSGFEAEGVLAAELARVWSDQVRERATTSGVLGRIQGVAPLSAATGLANPLCYVPNGDWQSLLQGPELDPDALVAHFKLSLAAPDAAQNPVGGKLVSFGYIGVDSKVAISTDADRGSILTYSERGEARTGGVNFPTPTAGGAIVTVSKTPTLDFWVRSSSADPLAIKFVGTDGHTAMVSLGRDRPGAGALPEADLQRDGQWHQLKLDLKQTGIDSIASIGLAPTPNSLRRTKITLGPVEYSFADFKPASDAPDSALPALAGDPNSTDKWARAVWAHSAAHSPQLAALLKDSDWDVRLNALSRYVEQPDPAVEPALTDNASEAIDGPVTVMALDALWKLGTDTAKETVHRVLKIGVTEEGRAEAAMLVTEAKDPSVVAELLGLTLSPSLDTRIVVVKALGRLPGPGPGVVRNYMHVQVDPEIKVAVFQFADPGDSDQAGTLEWSAVNEPSDAVRTEALEKLLVSHDRALQKAGYGGIKDDSVGVRLNLLGFFKEHPSEENRDSLRIAVADKSARVKAAAIEAFAAMDKGATAAELGSALGDRHPIVQLALIDLSRKRGLKIPADAVAEMKNSADPQVKAAASELQL